MAPEYSPVNGVYVESLPLEKIRLLEQRAKSLGLDERTLIENASSNLFSVIDGLHLGKKVLVVAGRGNNGADVLSCARKLFSKGYEVEAVVLTEKSLGREALFQKALLEKIGVSSYPIGNTNIDEFKDLLEYYDFIVEGILGIGVKGPVSPFLAKIIVLINESGKKIISCDIPSGLSPDEGVILGQAIKADHTITFIAPKQGFFINEGPRLCGKVFVVDIGISREILEKAENKPE